MANEKRLIDAEALKKRIGDLRFHNYGMALIAVCEAPTVDAVEVVHGRWEKFGYDFCCSACGVYQCGHYIGMTNYCPNCGAKMDGGADK